MITSLFVAVCLLQSPKDVAIHAWQSRSESLQSVRVAWVDREVLHVGVHGSRRTQLHEVQTRHEVVVVKDHIRHHRNGTIWDFGQKRLVNVDYYQSLSNGEARTLFLAEQGAGEDQLHAGYFHKSAVLDAANDFHLTAVTLFLRGANPAICGFDLRHFEYMGSETDHFGNECWRFEKAGEGIKETLWVDSREMYQHVLRRVLISESRYPLSDLIVAYIKSENGRWLPSTWTHTYYGGSEVLEELTVEDVQWEIDAAVRPGEIPVEFPPATHVCKEHSTEHWLVGEDGLWRELTPHAVPVAK